MPEAYGYLRYSHALEDSALDESSGMILGPKGSIWSHNDSQGEACLFVFPKDGKQSRKLSLANLENVDWEDLARVSYQKKDYVLVCDTGNNWHKRKESFLHLCELPKDVQSSQRLRLEKTVSVRFNEEVINCESIAYDESKDSLYLIEKNYETSTRLYKINDFMLGASERNAEELCILNLEIATAMDISRDGFSAAVLTPKAIHVYQRLESETWDEAFKKKSLNIALPKVLPQAEALCFTADGKSVLISTEIDGHGLKFTPIYEVSLEKHLAEKI